MANSISALSGRSRIVLIVDDYLPDNPSLNPSKTAYILESYITCTDYLDVEEGGGAATVVFNDKNFRYWKHYPFSYLNTRDWGDEIIGKKDIKSSEGQNIKPLTEALQNKNEIYHYKSILKNYANKHEYFKALFNFASNNPDGFNFQEDSVNGGILLPVIDWQNIIRIEHLGRDGKWYRTFKGIVNSINIKKQKNDTPTFTINAITPNRFFDLSYIVTGLNNIGKGYTSEIESLKNQKGSLAFTNKFNDMNAGQIIVQALKDCNDFFLKQNIPNIKDKDIDDLDYRYFKVSGIFGFGKKISQKESSDGTSNENIKIQYEGEKGYPINSEKFLPKTNKIGEKIAVRDIYPGHEVYYKGKPANIDIPLDSNYWLDLIMADEFFQDTRPFQNLLRTNLSLFTVDKMTVKEVLEVVKNTALCYIYFNGNGDLLVERPYFDMNLIGQTPYEDNKIDPDNQIDPKPLDYDGRYIISEQDRSFLSYSNSKSESAIVTRTYIEVKPDWLPGLPPELATMTYSGKSESSPKTIGKFGDRMVVLNSIVSPEFIYSSKARQILNSYCWSEKIRLSSKANNFSFELDQRPDLQLNRNMLFLDRGVYGLTKRISHTDVRAENRLNTEVNLNYVRYVGYQYINPWRYIISKSGESQGGYELVSWEVPKIKFPDKINETSTGTFTGNQILDEGATYSTVKNEMGTMLNANFDNFAEISEVDESKVYCYVLRPQETSFEGIDDNEDTFYFIWKDGNEEKIETLKGSGGDPQSSKSLYDENFQLSAKLNEGIYRFDGIHKFKDPITKKERDFLQCIDFNFLKVSKKFEKVGEISSAEDVQVFTLNTDSENNPLVSPLYRSTIQLGGIKRYNDKIVNYDTINLSLGLEHEDNWNNILNALRNKNQKDIVFFVRNYNEEIKENLNSENKDTQELSNDIDSIELLAFMYLNSFQNPFYNDRILKQGETNNLKTEGDNQWKDSSSFPSYDKSRWVKKVNTSVGGELRQYIGMFNVTQKIVDFSNWENQQAKDFLSNDQDKAMVAQKLWLNSYLDELRNVLSKKWSPNHTRSMGQLLDAVLRNISLKQNGIYYSLEGDLTSSRNYPCFAPDSKLNQKGGFLALMHAGVQYFNIPLRDISSQVQNVCYFLNSFYKFDTIEDFLNKYEESNNKSGFLYNFNINSSILANFKVELGGLFIKKVTHCSGLVKLMAAESNKWESLNLY